MLYKLLHAVYDIWHAAVCLLQDSMLMHNEISVSVLYILNMIQYGKV